jgi:succinate-semialdehyde dehydrogenase / glutarate-semialdehyde dehydrogenase
VIRLWEQAFVDRHVQASFSHRPDVEAGKSLAEMAGRHMKPAIMELGDHAPVIMCDDVDPVTTAATSVTSLATQGKSVFRRRGSLSRNRFISVSPIPLPKKPRIEGRRIRGGSMRWRRWSRTPNRKVLVFLAGGSRIGNRGYFVPLTDLADVPDECARHE